ncbi:aldo/keto reductase [Devosia sp. 1566]|uniref:aldo/keto reductase n=1 Tax=Devosia sp. 1566 TaxID=2499144 RepID=UPI000FD6C108|nr:aldo/keto reductase [Devosia sp. 1566]
MAGVPNVPLNDGNSIPQLGFGVWQVPNNEVQAAVSEALQAGYRSIDTAQGYNNEEGVGRAIKDSGIGREELFITSKLRTRDQAYDKAIKSFHGSLEKLGLDYLDLFLIHWPVPGQDKYPEAWKAFVQLQKEGLIKSIGVSNFLPEHLERIIGETGVTPAVNQIEVHPEYQQRDVLDFHVKNRIAIESYSPLGSGAALKNPTIAEIAEKHGKSPAQAILRWHIQEGFIVIPKSTHPERIRANIDVFDFELDGEDLQRIAGLDRPDGKTGGHPATNNAIW